MALTLTQLRTVITRDDALADLLTTAQSLGFNATSWQAGSVQRTLLTIFAQGISTYSETVDALSRLAFNSTSTGDAMTQFASSHYDNTRIGATFTEGLVELTGAAVGPPHVLAIGDVTVADSTGRTWKNIEAGTVPVSGSVSLSFRADVAGVDGNVANDTITVMQTTLAGTTANNPDPGSGTWITTLAVDAEADATLAARNTSKWGVLSVSDPAARYEHFVRTAVPGAVRVEVDDSNPQGPGTIDVYIAAATGVSPGADVTASQTELDRIRNPTATVVAIAAVAQSQAFVYTAYIQSALNTATTQAAIEAALRAYVNGLDIGGDVFPDSPIGIFAHSEAVGAMTAIGGVDRVELTTPAGNVNVTAHNVMTVASVTPTHTSI
jgi:uncharacterized phage protein gp47/JayE